MATNKITALTNFVKALYTDVLCIVDLTANQTKKITAFNLFASGPGWRKYTLDYTDWQPNVGAAGTITIFDLPAGALVRGVKIKHSTPFAGGTTATAVVSVTDVPGTSYITTFDVFQAAGNTVGAFEMGAASATVIPNHVAASSLRAVLTITGDVIDNLTAGEVDIWVFYEQVI